MSATLSLVKRGLTMLRAKRAIEEALDKGRAVGDAVQNWEAGRRRRNKAARSYLRVIIASLPDAAGEALEVALPRPRRP